MKRLTPYGEQPLTYPPPRTGPLVAVVHLSDNDLLPPNPGILARLDENSLRQLSDRLFDDPEETRDRFNRNSRNSGHARFGVALQPLSTPIG